MFATLYTVVPVNIVESANDMQAGNLSCGGKWG